MEYEYFLNNFLVSDWAGPIDQQFKFRFVSILENMSCVSDMFKKADLYFLHVLRLHGHGIQNLKRACWVHQMVYRLNTAITFQGHVFVTLLCFYDILFVLISFLVFVE